MLRLHLLRHAETEASREHRFCGARECALSSRGHEQVRRAAAYLAQQGDWRAIFTSPLERCRDMAGAVAAATGVPVTVDDGLREIDHGRWDGQREADVAAADPQAYAAYNQHPGVLGAPGGESGYQVAARALPVIEQIVGEYADGAVLVVSHKATLRIVTCALLSINIDLYRARIAHPVAASTVFEMRDSGPLLRILGDVSYLPPELRSSGGI